MIALPDNCRFLTDGQMGWPPVIVVDALVCALAFNSESRDAVQLVSRRSVERMPCS
jgi:hypothetical protein